MKKIILVLAIFAALIFTALILVIGMAQAKENNNEPLPNIANILKGNLKQMISIEETGNGNLAWLKGAKITEISSLMSTSTATTTTPNLLKVKIFGQDYKIQVMGDTNVVRYSWGKSEINLSEFSVGDIINVYGTLDSTDYFLIHAKTIRNVSIQKIHTVLNGTIQNIASSTNSFTLQTGKNSSTTVNTDSNTKIYQGKTLKTFSDLQTGTKVMVRGLLNKALAKVQALLIRIKPAEVEHETNGKSQVENACINSGGTVATSTCCKSTGDFPNLCLIGACGCSSENSHQVKTCDCGSSKCFNGISCTTAQ